MMLIGKKMGTFFTRGGKLVEQGMAPQVRQVRLLPDEVLNSSGIAGPLFGSLEMYNYTYIASQCSCLTNVSSTQIIKAVICSNNIDQFHLHAM